MMGGHSRDELQGLPGQLKSRFDPPKVVFPLAMHVPPENRLGEAQDTMRQEKSPHGKPGAASRRCHLEFDLHVQLLRGARRSQKLGRWNAMFSVVDHPTPSNRIRNRVPNPIGPSVSFSTSSIFGFHSGSRRTSVQ